jgi:hypothetical protein
MALDARRKGLENEALDVERELGVTDETKAQRAVTRVKVFKHNVCG